MRVIKTGVVILAENQTQSSLPTQFLNYEEIRIECPYDDLWVKKCIAEFSNVNTPILSHPYLKMRKIQLVNLSESLGIIKPSRGSDWS